MSNTRERVLRGASLGELDARGLTLLEAAVRRVSTGVRASVVRSAGAHPASRRTSASSSSTRQARHVQVLRARDLGIAACLVSATEDQEYLDLWFSPAFAFLRPYSSGPYAKLEHLAASGHVGDPAGWERIWERGYREIVVRARALQRLEDALVVHASIAAMFIALIVAPARLAGAWPGVWRDAQRRRLLSNPYFRMQLALMGAFAGECGPHLEWLMTPSSLRLELADVLCFVRRDSSLELLNLIATNVRGRPHRPRACLYSVQPASTVNALLHYARRCLRSPAFLMNGSLCLMVLTWIDETARLVRSLDADDPVRDQLPSIKDSLRRVQKVQVMEKARFWEICGAMTPGATQARMLALWAKSPELGD